LVDIALCAKPNKCPKQDSCLRFNKKDNINVQYFHFENICSNKNNYKWYWEYITDIVPAKKESENNGS
jgi:hypothetical protein